MDVYLTRDGSVVEVTVDGELTVESRQSLRHAVLRELERGGRRFWLDFGRVPYVDSAGLGGLVTLWRAVRAVHGELRLTNVTGELRTLFELTKLEMLLAPDDDPGTAGRAAPLRPTRGPLEGREQAELPPPDQPPG